MNEEKLVMPDNFEKVLTLTSNVAEIEVRQAQVLVQLNKAHEDLQLEIENYMKNEIENYSKKLVESSFKKEGYAGGIWGIRYQSRLFADYVDQDSLFATYVEKMISGFNEYNKEVNLSDKDFSRIIKKIVKNIIRDESLKNHIDLLNKTKRL